MNTDLETYQAPATPALRAGNLDYPTILKLGEAFAASGLFSDVKDAGTAAVKIMAGAEMGLEPVAAMNGIDIIPGRQGRGPRMRPSADVQAWLAARAGYTYRAIEHTAEKCILEWAHNGKVIGTSEFSVAQARKAGLVRDGGAWNAWPEPMTLARAVTLGVKLYCRHVLAGQIGGMPMVTMDELDTEYPDPRDDLVKALHATYREAYPKRDDESPDEYRERRLDWSMDLLPGRAIRTWNGPQAPETLTRADVQTLLDALKQTSTPEPPKTGRAWSDDPSGWLKAHPQESTPALTRGQAAPISSPDAASAAGADSMQGSVGGDVSENVGQSATSAPTRLVTPAEHHTAETEGEAAPADGTVPEGRAGAIPDSPLGAAPTKSAPSRKRHKTDPTGAPGVKAAMAQAQQFRDDRKTQTVVEHAGWIEALPPEAVYNLMTFFQNADNPEAVSESVVRVFARRNIIEHGAEWTPEQIDKLAAETWRKQ